MSDVQRVIEDGVATLVLDRPEARNTVTTAMLAELIDAFDEVDRDDEVRVIVVTGSGSTFCAGADLGGGGGSFGFTDEHRDSGGRVALRIYESTKPVIAAVNGHAVGFGASITLPMDFRVVAAEAKLGFPFAARGIVPDGASSWFLSKIVGLPRALDWCVTGRLFDAEEARSAGLATSVVPAEQVLGTAQALARSIAEGSAPVSVALTRQLLWQNAGAESPYAAHQVESAGIAFTGSGADAKEGITAFRERRRPEWGLSVPADLPSWFPWADSPAWSPMNG